MAKICQRFEDNGGGYHDTPEQAAIADIALALGRLSADGGISGGVAKLILEKRAEIETAFRELDQMRRRAGVGG